MQNVIGMEPDFAVKILKQQGFDCEIRTYESGRPFETDAVRVVAQRKNGSRVTLIVSGFKTKV